MRPTPTAHPENVNPLFRRTASFVPATDTLAPSRTAPRPTSSAGGVGGVSSTASHERARRHDSATSLLGLPGLVVRTLLAIALLLLTALLLGWIFALHCTEIVDNMVELKTARRLQLHVDFDSKYPLDYAGTSPFIRVCTGCWCVFCAVYITHVLVSMTCLRARTAAAHRRHAIENNHVANEERSPTTTPGGTCAHLAELPCLAYGFIDAWWVASKSPFYLTIYLLKAIVECGAQAAGTFTQHCRKLPTNGINQVPHTPAPSARVPSLTLTHTCLRFPFHTALVEYSRGGVEPGALTFYTLAILGNAAVPLMISKVQTLWEPQSVGRLVSWILLLSSAFDLTFAAFPHVVLYQKYVEIPFDNKTRAHQLCTRIGVYHYNCGNILSLILLGGLSETLNSGRTWYEVVLKFWTRMLPILQTVQSLRRSFAIPFRFEGIAAAEEIEMAVSRRPARQVVDNAESAVAGTAAGRGTNDTPAAPPQEGLRVEATNPFIGESVTAASSHSSSPPLTSADAAAVEGSGGIDAAGENERTVRGASSSISRLYRTHAAVGYDAGWIHTTTCPVEMVNPFTGEAYMHVRREAGGTGEGRGRTSPSRHPTPQHDHGMNGSTTSAIGGAATGEEKTVSVVAAVESRTADTVRVQATDTDSNTVSGSHALHGVGTPVQTLGTSWRLGVTCSSARLANILSMRPDAGRALYYRDVPWWPSVLLIVAVSMFSVFSLARVSQLAALPCGITGLRNAVQLRLESPERTDGPDDTTGWFSQLCLVQSYPIFDFEPYVPRDRET